MRAWGSLPQGHWLESNLLRQQQFIKLNCCKKDFVHIDTHSLKLETISYLEAKISPKYLGKKDPYSFQNNNIYRK